MWPRRPARSSTPSLARSRPLPLSGVAQSAEQRTVNPLVVSSSLTPGALDSATSLGPSGPPVRLAVSSPPIGPGELVGQVLSSGNSPVNPPLVSCSASSAGTGVLGPGLPERRRVPCVPGHDAASVARGLITILSRAAQVRTHVDRRRVAIDPTRIAFRPGSSFPKARTVEWVSLQGFARCRSHPFRPRRAPVGLGPRATE